jgi:SulP family sulfate permease
MVLISTFLLTVFLDLTIAIQVGMLLAVILFMRRMASVTNVGFITRELNDEEEQADPNAISFRQVPKGVEVFEINGPFFFGATSKFQDELRLFKTFPQIIVLRMRNVPAIDASGLHTLREFYHNMQKQNIKIILSGVHTQPLFAMTQAGLLDLYGEEFIFGNIDDSLDKARELLGLPKLGRPENFVPSVAWDK